METDTTKESSECRFICPKTLRDMLMKLGEVQPKRIHDLVTVSFIFSGLRAKFLKMTCPKGYVCILETLGPISYPESESNLVPRLTSILILVWRMKKLLKDTRDVVNDEEIFIPTSKNRIRKPPIQSAFHFENYVSPKKRKTSNSSSSSNHDTTNSNSEV
ncbi:hypothetical protein INT45_003204 [Circinella minor]|uniref:Uncharacterized protein n=1 Tax=Circinella minor TaxID=1195481 RepID=A0A8H7RU06_9FUNG|nr:hypothetical protein INT45_003204 [Circinella minor]